MELVVAASDEQWEALTRSRTEVTWKRVTHQSEFIENKAADAFFSLIESDFLPDRILPGKPVFINSVIKTLKELNTPANVLRINGWPGFLERPEWEIAGTVSENVKSIFEGLDIKLNRVNDEPGFIAARIIAMIINEAYLTVADKVSSKPEIDIAMKLGTNYPNGPFEWAEAIGKKNILDLLTRLSSADKRYEPSALLIKEVN